MTIAGLIAEAAPSLTPSERRVGDSVAHDPQAVAFGTVAELAASAGTSGPTVVRFASKLGFRGFGELQAAVQAEIADALRPAATRIRERPAGSVLERVVDVDVENVRATLAGIPAEEFDRTIELVAKATRVFVLAGEIARGTGVTLTTQLDLLRDAVVLVGGTPVRVARQLADAGPDDVLIAIEHRRYERWLLEALARAGNNGVPIVALTDRALSPLALDARHTFVVAARGAGPFDSHTATMAVAHALAAGVAARLRRSATARLDAVERAWLAGDALVDG